jgi:hypothetical protein
MSDKNKVLLVGIGLAAAAIAVAALFFFLGKGKPAVGPEGPDSSSPEIIDNTIYTRKGEIVFISVEGTDMTVSSEKETYSFSFVSADITGPDGSLIKPEDITLGMEVEASVQRGVASAVRVLSLPLLSVISPKPNSEVGLSFNIEGIVFNKEGSICLSLINRRTGTAYEDGLSAAISSDRKFSLRVDLSSAFDAMADDMLDAKLSICGEEEEIPVSWMHTPGYVSKIKIFFLKGSCSNFYYVERIIPASISPTRAAIEEMLKGPNAKEARLNIFSAANQKEKIRSINVQGDTVYIDFNSTIVNVSRCSLSTLKTQIVKTLGELPSGQKYVLTVEGEEDNPLN